jgi:hypothetical protein
LWAFLFCPKKQEQSQKIVGKGGFKVLNHAALASSYNRGNHFAYGHFKNKHNEKVQHLEAVSTVKPQKEKREYFYDKRNSNESNPFKTYSKKDIEKKHQYAKEAEQIYNNWRHELAESSADFIHTIKSELAESAEAAADSYREEMYESLDKFLSGLKNDLETLLEKAPQGQVKKHMKSAHQLLETVRELLWYQIEKIVKEHDPAVPENHNDNQGNDIEAPLPAEESNPVIPIPPVTNPVITPAPYQVFSPGSFKLEVTVGSLTSKITFSDPNKKSEGTTMFYVVDGYGTRKAVDIKFSNETVQKLFEERMMDSKVYKKEISLERFNAVLKKIEAYMKELASIDPERLKSKVYGEKESLKLNNVIDKFTDLFYSLRK